MGQVFYPLKMRQAQKTIGPTSVLNIQLANICLLLSNLIRIYSYRTENGKCLFKSHKHCIINTVYLFHMHKILFCRNTRRTLWGLSKCQSVQAQNRAQDYSFICIPLIPPTFPIPEAPFKKCKYIPFFRVSLVFWHGKFSSPLSSFCGKIHCICCLTFFTHRGVSSGMSNLVLFKQGILGINQWKYVCNLYFIKM